MRNNLLNKAGERRSYPAGDKLPESTREIDSTLLGRLLNCTGEVAPLECLVFRRGTILDQDFRGYLLGMSVYSAEEC